MPPYASSFPLRALIRAALSPPTQLPSSVSSSLSLPSLSFFFLQPSTPPLLSSPHLPMVPLTSRLLVDNPLPHVPPSPPPKHSHNPPRPEIATQLFAASYSLPRKLQSITLDFSRLTLCYATQIPALPYSLPINCHRHLLIMLRLSKLKHFSELRSAPFTANIVVQKRVDVFHETNAQKRFKTTD